MLLSAMELVFEVDAEPYFAVVECDRAAFEQVLI
jgi:hypothetical protein